MFVRKASLKPIDFRGLSIADYTANSDLGSSLATIVVPSGSNHPKAWSKRSDKYYFVMEGRVQFTVNGEITELAQGDFCVVSQGTVFSYRNVSAEPAGLILVHTPAFELSAEVFVE